MEMITTRTPTRRVEYKDWIVYKGNEYVREETLSLKSYSWESEPDNLIDLHFIAWRSRDGNELVEYYSGDIGWSGEDGHLHKDNPVPEIELEFKRTIGKDLIYF